MIRDLATFKNIFKDLVDSGEPLAHVVHDGGILDLHHNDCYVHKVQREIIERTLVVHFLISHHLVVPRAYIKTREGNATREAAKRQQDGVSLQLLRREDSQLLVALKVNEPMNSNAIISARERQLNETYFDQFIDDSLHLLPVQN